MLRLTDFDGGTLSVAARASRKVDGAKDVLKNLAQKFGARGSQYAVDFELSVAEFRELFVAPADRPQFDKALQNEVQAAQVTREQQREAEKKTHARADFASLYSKWDII